MDKQLSASLKKELLLQRVTLLAQIADLRGGTVGRAEASAEHFGQSEDTRAQASTARFGTCAGRTGDRRTRRR